MSNSEKIICTACGKEITKEDQGRGFYSAPGRVRHGNALCQYDYDPKKFVDHIYNGGSPYCAKSKR